MAEKGKEKIQECKRKWRETHMDQVRKENKEAVKRYRDRKYEEDPEGFREYRNASARESMKRSYAKKRAAMTEEELEEYRRVTRERVAAIRAKKKAERLAQQAAADTDNKGTV